MIIDTIPLTVCLFYLYDMVEEVNFFIITSETLLGKRG